MHWIKIKLVKESRPGWAKRITHKEDVHAMLKRYYRFHDREEVLVVCLDNQNVPIAVHSLAVGTMEQCLVDPRTVFKLALLANASRVIMVHNHISDSPVASKEDRHITERLKKGGQLLGIQLLDSLIVSGNQVKSILFP